METAEKLRNTIHQKTSAVENARAILACLIFLGFALSGIVEHGVTVVLSTPDFTLNTKQPDKKMEDGEKTVKRRYCDPPNMTVLAIYYDSSEETNIDDDDYDFSQLQEMFFQANLTKTNKMELLLKKFYLWGALISPIPASRLAVNIGPKKIFGYSLLGAAASTLLVPAAWLTSIHVGIRFFQGLFCGALIPAAHSLAVNWFSTFRRSSFVSLYSAKFVGYALCELLTIQVVQTFGPSSVYYITSVLTVLWFIPWSMMIFNTPDKHLMYFGRQKRPITLACAIPIASDFPLKNFLCSRPVWMSMGAIVGAYCAHVSINVGMRLYLKYVYNISENILSAVPFIMHTFFAVSCGHIVNYIQRIKLVSVTSSRRIFVYISHFIPAGLLFVIGFVGCGSFAPVLLYSLAIITSGAIYSGALCSTIDIAPNYAGTIVAFCCTFGTAGSIIMTYLISNVLNGEILGSWRLTFSFTSLILLVSSIFFMLRGSGAIQFWNDPNIKNENIISPKINEPRHSVIAPLPTKSRTKSIYTVEKKILKVLHVQEPDKFTRVRAYSTSLPNERERKERPNVFQSSSKKRASIT